MAITFRTPGLLSVTTTSTSHVVPTPTSFAAGDVLVLVSNVDSKSVTIATPSGWTLIDDISTSVALGNRVRVWTKVADGSEGSSVTLTLSTAKLGSAIMYGLIGAASRFPNAHATQDNPTSSTSQVAPAVTPNADDCAVITWVAAFINSSYTPPTGYTEDADQANADTTMEVSSTVLSGGANTSTGTLTATAGISAASIAGTLAFAPAPAVTPAVDATAFAGANNSTISWSHTCTGSNRYLVVFFNINGRIPTTVTYNGVAMTQLATVATRNSCFGLINPATGSNTIAASWGSSVAASCISVSLTGVNQTTPTGTAATAAVTSTSPSVVVTSDAAELVLASIGYTSTTSPTPGVGQTLVVSRPGDVTSNRAVFASIKGGSTSTTMSWTTLNLASDLIGIPLKPVGGGGSSPVLDATSGNGTSTASASTLSLPSQALAGASTGTSTVAASRIIVPFGLAGGSTGASTTAASSLKVFHGLAGASAGTSSTTADLTIPAPTGITVVNSATNGGGGVTTVSKPTGTIDGDLMVAAVHS